MKRSGTASRLDSFIGPSPSQLDLMSLEANTNTNSLSIVEEVNELRRNHFRRQREKQQQMRNLFRDALEDDVCSQQARNLENVKAAATSEKRRSQRAMSRALAMKARSATNSRRLCRPNSASTAQGWRRTGRYFRTHMCVYGAS